jgi:diguanylate cyclase (GGDEF)-like protein
MTSEIIDPASRALADQASAADRRFRLHVALPIASLMVVVLALAIAVLAWAAREQDRYAIAGAQRVVQGVIDSRKDLLAKRVLDYADWNDAFERLHVRLDPDWADANIGAWLFDAAGIDMSLVVAPDGRVAYATTAGTRANPLIGAPAPAGLQDLVGHVARHRHEHPQAALVRAAGRPAIAAAGIIRKESGLLPERPSLLVLVDLLDAPLLDEVQRLFGLADLRWQEAGENSQPGRLALTASDGTALGVLTWRLELPGSRMLRGMIPALATVLGGVGLLTALVLGHARQIARRLRAAEARVMHDPLTGLPNRLLLDDRLQQALATVRRERCQAAVLYLDLDGFKAVNDTFGHELGDELLVEVAHRLRHAVRETDTVARIGGDEFVVVQAGGAQPDTATGLCDRLLQVLARPYVLTGGCRVRINASIGVAVAPGDAMEPATLLRLADRAMYRAKDGGRGTFRLFQKEDVPAPALEAI